MDLHVAQEILACLQGERTVFPYYRDRYSIGLLRHLSQRSPSGPGFSVAALKQTPYAPLLQKPRVRTLLAGRGHGPLDAPYLALHDHDPQQSHFILNLALWGSARRSERRHRQISRPGFNLVLQLNFNTEHERRFRALGCRLSRFNYWGHPVSCLRNTLAWARLDVDLAANCALIEEIQSDWVRNVAWLEERARGKLAAGHPASASTKIYGLECSLATTLDYCVHVRTRYSALWAEAMLWAAIHFIRDELGINGVYYHSERGGQLLKGITGTAPPRSLYTDLPRRFCFTPTREVPAFLSDDKDVQRALRRHPDTHFFRLH